MISASWRLGAGAAALALLAGCASAPAQVLERPSPPTAGTRAPAAARSGVDAVRDFRSVRDYQATPVPVRIRIPRIHVAAALVRLGRAPDGTVEVPSEWDVPGWYAAGPRPGDPGSAVILGHVDSRRGPAVFFRLKELRAGDQIAVARADGSSVRFTVDRTAQFDKRRFPTEQVYYPTLTAELRLVTCGGSFDATTGHYRSNIIVFATVTA
jgi:sortase (surface protein transpeptidase)